MAGSTEKDLAPKGTSSDDSPAKTDPKKREAKGRKKQFRRQKPFWQNRVSYLHESNISYAWFRWLGYLMAFLGGAINAGGFFAVARYTSHMSGELARLADTLYMGEFDLAITSFFMVVSFVLGATHASWTILWAKRQRFRSSYGISMWMEATYLFIFALISTTLNELGHNLWVSPTIMFMCFIMGMHNTVMTILSNGVIRSTHMTGFTTDIGIELSKVLYLSRKDNPRLPDVHVNIPKIKLFSGVIFCFVAGGVVGAWGFHQLSYFFVYPVALILLLLGFGSIGYDFRVRTRYWLYRRKKRSERIRETQRSNLKDADSPNYEADSDSIDGVNQPMGETVSDDDKVKETEASLANHSDGSSVDTNQKRDDSTAISSDAESKIDSGDGNPVEVMKPTILANTKMEEPHGESNSSDMDVEQLEDHQELDGNSQDSHDGQTRASHEAKGFAVGTMRARPIRRRTDESKDAIRAKKYVKAIKTKKHREIQKQKKG